MCVCVNRAHASEVSCLVADIFGEGSLDYLSSPPERTESFHFTHRGVQSPAEAPLKPGPRRVAVQAFCYRRGCSDLKKQNASCSFIPSALRRRRRGTRGVPPFVCNSACVRVCLCVFGTRERRERERDRRVKQIGRAAQKTATFGHVLETEAARLQRLHKEK